MSIKSLPDDVISKIRTGIAVTSVPQCVEELVQNAIDAKATCIAVRLDLQFFKIQVVDNGQGISYADLKVVGDRYSTNKCFSLSDLENTRYYGYRGEALASICEISSDVTIVSELIGSDTTHVKTTMKGSSSQAGVNLTTRRPSHGTTVTVWGFLHNMPVRQATIDTVLDLERARKCLESLSLVHPGISFTLYDNGTDTRCLVVPKTGSLPTTFGQLFGVAWIRHLQWCQHSDGLYAVRGYLSSRGHRNRNLQFLYVHRRRIVGHRLQKAISEVLEKHGVLRSPKTPPNLAASPQNYTKLGATDLFPVFVLEIDCPRRFYDVGFHPTKTVIEFRSYDQLLGVAKELASNFLTSTFGSGAMAADAEKAPTELDVNAVLPYSDIAVQNVKHSLHSLAVKRPYGGGVAGSNSNDDTQPLDKRLTVTSSVVGQLPVAMASGYESEFHPRHPENDERDNSHQKMTPLNFTCLKTRHEGETGTPQPVSSWQQPPVDVTRQIRLTAALREEKTALGKLTCRTNSSQRIKNALGELQKFAFTRASRICTVSPSAKKATESGAETAATAIANGINVYSAPQPTKETCVQDKVGQSTIILRGHHPERTVSVQSDSCSCKTHQKFVNQQQLAPSNRDLHSRASLSAGASHTVTTSIRGSGEPELLHRSPSLIASRERGSEADPLDVPQQSFCHPSVVLRGNDFPRNPRSSLAARRENISVREFVVGRYDTPDGGDATNSFTRLLSRSNSPLDRPVSTQPFTVYKETQSFVPTVHGATFPVIGGLDPAVEVVAHATETVDVDCDRESQSSSPISVGDNRNSSIQVDETDPSHQISEAGGGSELILDLRQDTSNTTALSESESFFLNPKSLPVETVDVVPESLSAETQNPVSFHGHGEVENVSDFTRNQVSSVSSQRQLVAKPESTNSLKCVETDAEDATFSETNLITTWITDDSHGDGRREIYIDRISGNSYFENPNSVSLDNTFTVEMATQDKLAIGAGEIRLSTSSLPVRPWRRPASKQQEVDTLTTRPQSHNPEIQTIAYMLKTWNNPVLRAYPSEPELEISCDAKKLLSSRYKQPYVFDKSIFDNIQVIAQVDNKFIACLAYYVHPERSNSGKGDANVLLLFDQHAVHERIRLEQLTKDKWTAVSERETKIKMKYATSGNDGKDEEFVQLKASNLDSPLSLTIPAGLVRVALARTSLFLKCGLRLCASGDANELVVHTVPECLLDRDRRELKMNRPSVIAGMIETLIWDLVEEIEVTGTISTTIPKIILNTLKSFACKAAIKFGDPLTLSNCSELISNLKSCKLPFHCAHGRPSVVPLADLEELNYLQTELPETKLSFQRLKHQ